MFSYVNPKSVREHCFRFSYLRITRSCDFLRSSYPTDHSPLLRLPSRCPACPHVGREPAKGAPLSRQSRPPLRVRRPAYCRLDVALPSPLRVPPSARELWARRVGGSPFDFRLRPHASRPLPLLLRLRVWLSSSAATNQTGCHPEPPCGEGSAFAFDFRSCFSASSSPLITDDSSLPYSAFATPLLTASVSIARSLPATSTAIFSDSSPSADCLSPSADCWSPSADC